MNTEMLRELIWTLPFLGLLLAIAILPLAAKHWWERYYPSVAIGLGAVVIAHYVFQVHNYGLLFGTGHEYFSFIALIGSLFVVSGGIFIQTKGGATPLENTLFLFIASLTANILGTTGASMVFIRPWIRMNKLRFTTFHIVFFIFLVSNIGGGLTPIGDPPLFLGYLKGVPFWWVIQHVWHAWLLTIGYLLIVFYVFDRRNFSKGTPVIREQQAAGKHEWKFRGKRNLLFLGAILGSVFIDHPPFLREAIMIIAAILSLKTTPRDIHEANDFNFGPIKEVAILFLGIFATMIPALEWLEKYAAELGVRSPSHFFWLSGALSSILDNAPTYLNFLSLELGLFAQSGSFHLTAAGLPPETVILADILQHRPVYLMAISCSTVYFGAMTYIGNGPNFLVKSIADASKLHTPSFGGYIVRYSVPILLPIFFLIWWLFFHY